MDFPTEYKIHLVRIICQLHLVKKAKIIKLQVGFAFNFESVLQVDWIKQVKRHKPKK